MRTFMIAAFVTLCAGSASAQEEFGSYFTVLSTQDMYNSSGKLLTDFCQIVQQDRANYHRLKRRDEGDEGDPFFSLAEARQVISQSCYIASGQDYIVDDVMGGFPRYVWVQVIGKGGRITGVVVNEGGG